MKLVEVFIRGRNRNVQHIIINVIIMKMNVLKPKIPICEKVLGKFTDDDTICEKTAYGLMQKLTITMEVVHRCTGRKQFYPKRSINRR